jgi:hypothetical protein
VIAGHDALGGYSRTSPARSPWGERQTELLDPHRWKTQIEPANTIFESLHNLDAVMQPSVCAPRSSTK